MVEEKVTLHGVFMEVMRLGVLLVGRSGVGKSELALERTPRHGALQALALLAKPARAASCRPTPCRGARSRQGLTGSTRQNRTHPKRLRL